MRRTTIKAGISASQTLRHRKLAGMYNAGLIEQMEREAEDSNFQFGPIIMIPHNEGDTEYMEEVHTRKWDLWVKGANVGPEEYKDESFSFNLDITAREHDKPSPRKPLGELKLFGEGNLIDTPKAVVRELKEEFMRTGSIRKEAESGEEASRSLRESPKSQAAEAKSTIQSDYPLSPQNILDSPDSPFSYDESHKDRVKFHFQYLEEARKVRGPKIAICVTLYNEGPRWLEDTLRGLFVSIQNLKTQNPGKFSPSDISIFMIQDGVGEMEQELIDFLNVNSGLGIIDLKLINVSSRERNHQGVDAYYTEDTPMSIPHTGSIPKVHRRRMPRDIAWTAKEEELGARNNVLYLFQSKLSPAHPGCNHLLSKLHITQREALLQDKELSLNIFFGIKHFNGKKLESHLWFFRGFCEGYINPKYCVLLDVGTELEKNALLEMYHYLEGAPHCGGVCGELTPRLHRMDSTSPSEQERIGFLDILASYPLIWAQYAEYKHTHYVDRASESVFGVLRRMSSAFCGYRLKGILGIPPVGQTESPSNTAAAYAMPPPAQFRGTRPRPPTPLSLYLMGIKQHELTFYQANMYLHEDTIMPHGMLVNECGYNIHYACRALAITDSPTNLSDLLMQRKKWQNGSFFALFKMLLSICGIFRTKRSCCGKFGLIILFSFQWIMTGLSLIMTGITYVVLTILIRNQYPASNDEDVSDVAALFENLYIVGLFLTMIYSLGIKPHMANIFYLLVTLVFGGINIWTFYSLYYYIFDDEHDFWDAPQSKKITTISTFCIIIFYLLPILLNIPKYKNKRIIIPGLICYICLLSFFTNVITIYSFANTNDISWGDRPDQVSKSISLKSEVNKLIEEYKFESKKGAKEEVFSQLRVIWFCGWCVLNIVLSYVLIRLHRQSNSELQDMYLAIIFLLYAVVFGFRMLTAILYTIKN